MPPATLEELIAPHKEIGSGTSKGGNRAFGCIHCDNHFNGSQTRQLAHLLGIKGKGIAVCRSRSIEDRAALQQASRPVTASKTAPDPAIAPCLEARQVCIDSPYARLVCGGNAGLIIHGDICRLC